MVEVQEDIKIVDYANWYENSHENLEAQLIEKVILLAK